MSIEVVAPDATPEERSNALTAALEVFAAHGIEPEGAALGKEEVVLYERHRGKRGPVPSDEAYAAAMIFDKASTAAFFAMGGRHWNAEIRMVMDEGSYWAAYVAMSAVHQWRDPEHAPH